MFLGLLEEFSKKTANLEGPAGDSRRGLGRID